MVEKTIKQTIIDKRRQMIIEGNIPQIIVLNTAQAAQLYEELIESHHIDIITSSNVDKFLGLKVVVGENKILKI